MEDCIKEGILLGGYVKDNNFLGYWRHVAFGCSVLGEGGRIFYNANRSAINDGRYSPICKALEKKVKLSLSGEGIKCSKKRQVSVEECIAAASSVGGKLRDGKFLIGHWPNVPPGCFIGASDKTIYFSRNPSGYNDGNYQPVCIKVGYEAILEPPGFGSRCEEGYNFSADDCISAAESVGGILRGGKYLVGYWSGKPYGCFIDESDKAIHFGTNPNGINYGDYQLVCPSGSEISYEKANFLIENTEASLKCFIKETDQDLYMMGGSDNGSSVVMYGNEDYAKNSCNGSCPNSLFVLEKEPSQPDAWYIKASDRDLYMSVSGGNNHGNYVVMYGNEEYAKKTQCNGPCPNFVFVLEKVSWRFNSWYIKASDNENLNLLGGRPSFTNDDNAVIMFEGQGAECKGFCPRGLFNLECTILDG